MTAAFPFLVHRPRRVSMREIKARVSGHYHLTVADLESDKTQFAIAHPRQVAMYLARDLTNLSFPQIGQELGGRDHSTVVKGIRALERRRLEQPDLDAAIAKIRRDLVEPAAEIRTEHQLALFIGPLFDFADVFPIDRPQLPGRSQMGTERHGPTRREQQILDLQESGLAPAEIADELGLSKEYVQQVLGALNVGSGTDWWMKSAKHASEQLLAAIRLHHPEMCA